MEISDAIEFTRTHHRAVLATTKADGSPQLSPVSVAPGAEGRIVISTRETAMKVRHLRRDPRAWLCVMDDAFFGPWVQVTGTVQILSLPEAMEPLVEYYRSVAGEHPDWAEYREAMQSERRCLVMITPTAAGPTVHG